MDRGKRRSLGQRLGKKGEKVFEVWAADRGLSTNKVDEDLGIDYFCQVLRPVGKSRAEEATGSVIAVQVRATSGNTRPRVKLDRVDATNLLRQKNATCLVAVHLMDNSIRFLFLDEPFIDRLHSFLASPKDKTSIPLSEMKIDVSIFDHELNYYTKPGVVQRLLILKTEQSVRRAIPGASISIRQSANGGVALVKVPWIGSVLSVKHDNWETVRKITFEKGEVPRLSKVSLNPVLRSVLDLVDGNLMLQGKFEADAILSLEYKGQTAAAVFQRRCIDDEWAYTHPVGLCFVVSDARKRGDTCIHEMHVRIFPSRFTFNDVKDILPFLGLLRKGAKFFIDGHILFPVETWGEGIIFLGPAIEAFEKILELFKLDMKDFQLIDFESEEFGRTLSFLDLLLLRDIPLTRLVRSFLLGPISEKDPDSIPTRPFFMEVPIVMNLKSNGLVIWVKIQGAFFLNDEGVVCGLQIGEMRDCSYEFHPKFVKSVYPELWITKNWPAIRIGGEESGTYEFMINDDDYITLEARILDQEESDV